MDKNHITVECLLHDPGYSGEHTHDGSKVALTSAIYSNRTWMGSRFFKTSTTMVKDRESYLRRPRKGYPPLQDACQIQTQVQYHAYHRNRVLPPESLAKSSGCGQRGTLERKCIGSLVDSGSQSITSTLSTQAQNCAKVSPHHSGRASTPPHPRPAPRDQGGDPWSPEL